MANSKRLGPGPVIKLYDTDGTVLASGTVETYITGTSTPKNSYSDSAGSGSATSFTLDAYGEAVRYFDTDVDYKLVIKDSGGTTVRTIDPYHPVPAPFQLDNDLDTNGFSIISSSNADITITPNGTGSIVLDGLSWPQADGTNGQILVTDGAGQLSWTSAASELSVDTTPQLGGDLDCNSYNIQFDDATGIADDSGNEQLIFQKTTSAVNYIEITNAASGSYPLISSAGSDSNIGLGLSGKGTGGVSINGILYPTSDGNAGDIIQTDGAGTLSFVSPESALGEASQAQMEAGTATDVYVSPANIQYHPGAAKVVGVFQIDGTVDWSHNIASVTDTGTGNWTVNFDVTLSSANFNVIATPIDNTTTPLSAQVQGRTTTSCTIYVINTSGALTDPSYGVSVVVMGDL